MEVGTFRHMKNTRKSRGYVTSGEFSIWNTINASFPPLHGTDGCQRSFLQQRSISLFVPIISFT